MTAIPFNGKANPARWNSESKNRRSNRFRLNPQRSAPARYSSNRGATARNGGAAGYVRIIKVVDGGGGGGNRHAGVHSKGHLASVARWQHLEHTDFRNAVVLRVQARGFQVDDGQRTDERKVADHAGPWHRWFG